MRYSGASVLPLLFALFAGCHGSTELLVGQLQNLSTQESNGTVTFIFYLNKTAEGQVSPHLRGRSEAACSCLVEWLNKDLAC